MCEGAVDTDCLSDLSVCSRFCCSVLIPDCFCCCFLGRCDDVCKNSDTPFPFAEPRDAAEEIQGKCSCALHSL